jgi:hypothetical protein
VSTNALDLIAARAESSRAFLAFDLARMRDAGEAGERLLSDWLTLDDERLKLLSLCRSPRRDGGFRDDVRSIADYLSLDALRLASLVRLIDALRAFSTAPTAAREGQETLLTAARDISGEPSLIDDLPPRGTRFQPTWLHRAMDTFWGDDRPNSFPVNVALEAVTRLPLALFEVKNLSTQTLDEWLETYGAPLHLHVSPRPLRAALIAYGGVGVIFVDSDLDEPERLVSVAHESGHFMTDYLMVRSDVEASAPHLVEVLDGLREPTEDDFIAAVLNRLPLGVHTHLLARSDLGEYASAETERSEERATRVAWELLAPQARVEERVSQLGNPFELTSVLRKEFGLPVAAARAYAAFLHRLDGHSGRGFRLDP